MTVVYQPQLATEIKRVTFDPTGWAFEQKLDGHRVVLHVTSTSVVPITRGGKQYTRQLPRSVTECFDGLEGFVFDGELVGNDYWIFDVIEIPTLVNPDTVFSERRAYLEAVFSQVTQLHEGTVKLVPSVKLDGMKHLMVLDLRLQSKLAEGFILKNPNSVYRPGVRSGKWLKHKYVKTADLVVTNIGIDGKDNAEVSYWSEGKLVPVGKFSTIGKPQVQIGDVVEVKYLYLAANARLYQPRMVKVRDDKSPTECTPDQLIKTSKEVLNFAVQ